MPSRNGAWSRNLLTLASILVFGMVLRKRLLCKKCHVPTPNH